MAGPNLTLVDPYSAPSRAPGQRVSFQFWRQPVYQLSDGTYWHPGSDGPTYLVNIDSAWSYVKIAIPGSLTLTGKPETTPCTPGKATVHVRRSRDVDKKKAAGNDGGRITIHGIEPSQVEIDLLIWTPEQLRQLSILWPILFPFSKKGSPKAYDVDHPLLRMHGIHSLQFVSGEGPDIDGQGRGTFRMSAWEFAQPSKKDVTTTNVQAIGSLLDAGAVPTTASGYALPGSDPSNLGPT